MFLRIRKICKEKNKRLTHLEKETGVQRKFFYIYDRGEAVPRLDTAKRIAEALGVTVDDLIDTDDKGG